MKSDELLQADIIAKLKTITSVTSLLTNGASDIKELQWQGDQFGYPSVRLDIEKNEYTYDEQERCQISQLTFSLYIFSEERSSKQCSQIKGLLETALTGIGFTGTNARYLRLKLADNVPAIRSGEMEWRSQLQYQTNYQNIV